jgi:riboflavin kinase / FMN adenylyltransferase
MKISRLLGLRAHLALNQPAAGHAVTIGNFDGLHIGHQSLLRQLKQQAQRRQLQSCVVLFEPHPRDYFAQQQRKLANAPQRIQSLRDKLAGLHELGIDHCLILKFDAKLAALSAADFIDHVLVKHLRTGYLLVGDDFRFGSGRTGNALMLAQAASHHGFDFEQIQSHQTQLLSQDGLTRASSTALRLALNEGHMHNACQLLGKPYAISGHVVRGRQLGRELGASHAGAGDGFRTLNLRFNHWNPAASGIFVVQVHGLHTSPLRGVANLGVRPSLDPADVNGGRVLLETHCFDWPSEMAQQLPQGEAYGKIIRVELLHKLHDELKYDSLEALTQGIANDCAAARQFFNV